jgi:hypothetical protein
MPKDASPNGGASPRRPVGPRRVSEMQAKLHRWAVADRGRRFDDLFNLVHDPETLIAAWLRVAASQGAKTAGSDGWTLTRIENENRCLWVFGPTTCPAEKRGIPAAAGAGTQDPQTGWVGQGPSPRNSDGDRPGGAGWVEAGAGTDF